VALSEIDRTLLSRCMAHQSQAWEDFVDRFLGLVIHVVGHSAKCRSIRLTREDSEDPAAEVFLAIVNNDFAILRRFRGQCSLATYLTVVARRIAVRELLRRKSPANLGDVVEAAARVEQPAAPVEARISDREEVERLLEGLNGTEATVVRMYHLEGKTYKEISASVGMPENSIGPMLSRARAKMRQAGADSPTA
jgi:RNA polymerase sigma-70 factor (ECF subfamily)